MSSLAPHLFQPGNQLATKTRPITDLINRIVKQDEAAYEHDKTKIVRLRAGLEKVFDVAATGDITALTFLRDTAQGKPAQAIQLDDDGATVQFAAIRMIVVKPVDNTLIPNTIKDITHE